MNESKHTQGPWTPKHCQDLRPNGSIYEIVDNRGAVIARTVSDSCSDRANAQLIATTPELLEALKEISEPTGAFSRDPLTHANNTIENVVDIAKAAITKAQPKQEAEPVAQG